MIHAFIKGCFFQGFSQFNDSSRLSESENVDDISVVGTPANAALDLRVLARRFNNAERYCVAIHGGSGSRIPGGYAAAKALKQLAQGSRAAGGDQIVAGRCLSEITMPIWR